MEHLCFLSSDGRQVPLRSLSSALCTLDFLTLSPVSLVAQLCLSFAAPWTIALQAPLSLEFSRQEYWSRLPFPTPRDPPSPGIQLPSLCIGRRILYHSTTWETLTQLKTWLDFGNWHLLLIYFDSILDISYFDTKMHLESPLHFISHIHGLISPGGIINSVGWVRKWGLEKVWCAKGTHAGQRCPTAENLPQWQEQHPHSVYTNSVWVASPPWFPVQAVGLPTGPWSPSSWIRSQMASVFLYYLSAHWVYFSSMPPECPASIWDYWANGWPLCIWGQIFGTRT